MSNLWSDPRPFDGLGNVQRSSVWSGPRGFDGKAPTVWSGPRPFDGLGEGPDPFGVGVGILGTVVMFGVAGFIAGLGFSAASRMLPVKTVTKRSKAVPLPRS